MIEKQKRQNEEQERNKNILDLFRQPRIRKNTLVMLTAWTLISMQFDAYIRNIVNLQFSIYASFTISAILELPADLLSIWGLNWIGRRWSAALSQFLAGICSLICVLYIDNSTVLAVAALTGRFLMTYCMNTGHQITFEVLPTELRGQGIALANTLGISATLLSPVIVYTVSDLKSIYSS